MRVIDHIFIFAFAFAVPSAQACHLNRQARVSGTYSNLQYNEEGGDLLGIEIKIVPIGNDRFQAAIVVSDGAPAPMVLVDVHVANGLVSFKVPAQNQDLDDAWSFTGTLSANGLKGIIAHSAGGKEQVILPRRCGYCDR